MQMPSLFGLGGDSKPTVQSATKPGRNESESTFRSVLEKTGQSVRDASSRRTKENGQDGVVDRGRNRKPTDGEETGVGLVDVSLLHRSVQEDGGEAALTGDEAIVAAASEQSDRVVVPAPPVAEVGVPSPNDLPSGEEEVAPTDAPVPALDGSDRVVSDGVFSDVNVSGRRARSGDTAPQMMPEGMDAPSLTTSPFEKTDLTDVAAETVDEGTESLLSVPGMNTTEETTGRFHFGSRSAEVDPVHLNTPASQQLSPTDLLQETGQSDDVANLRSDVGTLADAEADGEDKEAPAAVSRFSDEQSTRPDDIAARPDRGKEAKGPDGATAIARATDRADAYARAADGEAAGSRAGEGRSESIAPVEGAGANSGSQDGEVNGQGASASSFGVPSASPEGESSAADFGRDHVLRQLEEPLQELVESMTRQAGPGRSEQVSIRLKPEFLGEVLLRVSVDAAGTVNARFVVDNAVVRSMIEQDLGQLQASLDEHGLSLGEAHVDSGFGSLADGQGGFPSEESHAPLGGRTSVSAAADGGDEPADNTPAPASVGAGGSIDIRV